MTGRLPGKRHSYLDVCPPRSLLQGGLPDEKTYGRKGPQIPFYAIDIGTEKWAILGVIWYFILKHP